MKAHFNNSIAIFCLSVCFLPIRALADPHAITMDMTTNLQPLGGAFRFSVTPALADAALPTVFLCPTPFDADFYDDKGVLASPDAIKKVYDGAVNLKELTAAQAKEETDAKAAEASACLRLTVQRLPAGTGTPSTSNFSAALSDQLPSNFMEISKTYIAGLDNSATNALFRRLVTGGWMHVWIDANTTQRFKVGVTWRPLAALGALATVLAFAWGLAGFAKTQGVPGPGKPIDLNFASLPIRLISSNGRASLSQFQIMLWTFVVLGGVVYVVLLNGALIPLTSGTLVLLGISGAATLIAQAKDATAPSQAPAMPRPGKVEGVNVGNFADSPDLIVKWSPPLDLTPVLQYVVRYGKVVDQDKMPNDTFTVIVRDTGVRLVEMDGKTKYAVEVCAANSAGQGDPVRASTTDGAKTVTSGPEVDPTAPTDLDVLQQTVTESALDLAWTTGDKDKPYDVQFRRADSQDDWAPASIVPAPNTNQRVHIANLDSGVIYNFRIRKQGKSGVWSKTIRGATQHRPRWSDLVTEPDRPNEIEVTRVQMLLFTIVTAGFVTIKIIDISVIPEIPQEYLILMGISNSVYLSGKWARR